MRNTTWMLALALVAMIGATGCGSDDNTPLPSAPIDTAPPVLPSGLLVSYDATTYDVVVSWDPNTIDLDFAGFLVTRTIAGETVELINQPENVTTYEDNLQGIGRDVIYRVYSVDETGNVSAAANVNVQIDLPQSHMRNNLQ